jgi:hypothetical protein
VAAKKSLMCPPLADLCPNNRPCAYLSLVCAAKKEVLGITEC